MPTRVRVGPYTFRVSEAVREHYELCCREGYCYGWCDCRNLLILIDPHIPLSQKQDTILHEIEHAIWYVAGIRKDDSLSEEEVISRTGAIRLSVYQQNPLLMAYVMQQEGEDVAA